MSKTKTTKPKTEKPAVVKVDKKAEIVKLLKQLESAKTANRKKMLRKKLRTLGHIGGLKGKSNG